MFGSMGAWLFVTVKCRYCGSPVREGTGLFMCGEGIEGKVEGGCRHDDTAAVIRNLYEQLETAERDISSLTERMDKEIWARVDAQEQLEVLREFFIAHWEVEQGITDFDLHAEAVERLRAAMEPAYRVSFPAGSPDGPEYDERTSELDVVGAEAGWTGAPDPAREPEDSNAS